MVDRSRIIKEWGENVVTNYDVPSTLFAHQLDSIALLQQGRNVFLGNKRKLTKFSLP